MLRTTSNRKQKVGTVNPGSVVFTGKAESRGNSYSLPGI